MHINGFGGLNEMSAGREAERRLNTETRAMPHVRLYIQYTQTINGKKNIHKPNGFQN